MKYKLKPFRNFGFWVIAKAIIVKGNVLILVTNELVIRSARIDITYELETPTI